MRTTAFRLWGFLELLCLRQVTLPWNTPPEMVMLSITGVTLTPLSDGKGHAGRCYSTLMKVAVNGSFCNLFTKDFLLFLARFAFGLHLCLHILGCFVELSQRHPRCTLLFDRKGWTQLPWHWCKPKRSSNIIRHCRPCSSWPHSLLGIS